MKAHCIQATQVLRNGKWEACTIGVQDEKWIQSHKIPTSLNMCLDSFWISPGKVHIDLQFPLYDTEFQSALVRRYMFRGTTLLLIQCPITSTRTMRDEFNKMKQNLDGLAIDYMICPRVPLHRLTPEMIRYFGLERVPLLLFEAQTTDLLKDNLWGWFAQAQDPSFLPLLPVFTNELLGDQESFSKWKELAKSYNVRTLPNLLDEQPLSKENLRATGIYPYKGEFMYTGDADYNLFRKQSSEQIDTPDQMFYHKAIPCVTVLRGRIIRSHTEVNDMEGYGKYQTVSIPNHFLS